MSGTSTSAANNTL